MVYITHQHGDDWGGITNKTSPEKKRLQPLGSNSRLRAGASWPISQIWSCWTCWMQKTWKESQLAPSAICIPFFFPSNLRWFILKELWKGEIFQAWDWLQKSCWVWWDVRNRDGTCQRAGLSRWIPQAGMQMQLCQEMQKELEKFKVTWDQNNDSEFWRIAKIAKWLSGLEQFLIKPHYLSPLDNPFPLIENIPKKGL